MESRDSRLSDNQITEILGEIDGDLNAIQENKTLDASQSQTSNDSIFTSIDENKIKQEAISEIEFGVQLLRNINLENLKSTSGELRLFLTLFASLFERSIASYQEQQNAIEKINYVTAEHIKNNHEENLKIKITVSELLTNFTNAIQNKKIENLETLKQIYQIINSQDLSKLTAFVDLANIIDEIKKAPDRNQAFQYLEEKADEIEAALAVIEKSDQMQCLFKNLYESEIKKVVEKANTQLIIEAKYSFPIERHIKVKYANALLDSAIKIKDIEKLASLFKKFQSTFLIYQIDFQCLNEFMKFSMMNLFCEKNVFDYEKFATAYSTITNTVVTTFDTDLETMFPFSKEHRSNKYFIALLKILKPKYIVQPSDYGIAFEMLNVLLNIGRSIFPDLPSSFNAHEFTSYCTKHKISSLVSARIHFIEYKAGLLLQELQEMKSPVQMLYVKLHDFFNEELNIQSLQRFSSSAFRLFSNEKNKLLDGAILKAVDAINKIYKDYDYHRRSESSPQIR